jgi:hypothetical protein
MKCGGRRLHKGGLVGGLHRPEFVCYGSELAIQGSVCFFLVTALRGVAKEATGHTVGRRMG